MAATWNWLVLSFILPRLVCSLFVTKCGGVLTQPHGHIQTPNFPNQFPIPISCQWVIHAPPANKIVIYFTQYYVKRSFTLSEYDQFESAMSFKGKNILGEVDFEDALTSLTAYKPYVVIEFKVRDHNNLHLRVEEYLQDVYGFNITYETLPLDAARKHSCSVDQCSYLGNCVANENYTEYRCDCFDKYSGSECQYGPYCNPDRGLNQCENGGKCRYFYGSMVNTCVCPTGYEGVKCQIKKRRYHHSECDINCSNRCEQANNGSFYCACDSGFRLLDDGITCIEKESYRVDFLMTLQTNSSSQMLEKPNTNPGPVRFITSKLIRNFIRANFTTVTNAEFDGIRLINNQRKLCFHLLLDDSEVERLRETLPDLVMHMSTLLQRDLVDFLGIHINPNQSEVSFQPDARLLYVDTFDEQPALEGALLTINCAAKGSSNMVFRWYKDGALLNTSLSNRNAWQIHIPQTIDGKQTNVLNIDGVTFYDKGKFTCEITDFNRSQTDSVIIDVITYPLLDMRPLSQTVVRGKALSFRCLSSDDTRGTFSYNWLKDGKALTSADQEVVEKVQPTGERLLVPAATRSTSYTCVVSNMAGTTRETAYVFVADENATTAMFCREEVLLGNTWSRTLGGQFDIKQCPSDTGDVWMKPVGNCYSRRACHCHGDVCRWKRPNFSKCQSGFIVRLFDKLKKIQLGYKVDTMTTVWNDLYGVVLAAHNWFYAGDIDMASSIFYKYVNTLLDFNVLYQRNDNFTLQTVLDLFSILLEDGLNTTDEEKKELFVGPKLLRVAEMMASLTFPGFNFVDELEIEHRLFVAKVKKLRLAQLAYQSAESADKEVSNDVTFLRSRRRLDSTPQPPNSSNATNSSDTWGDDGDGAHQTETMFVLEIDAEFIELLLDQHTGGVLNHTLISRLQSVSMLENFNSMDTKQVQLIFPHQRKMSVQFLPACVSWHSNESNFLYGYWTEDDCSVVGVGADSTTCVCTVPGHFGVIAHHVTHTVVAKEHTFTELIIIGCVMATGGLLATFLIYLFAWRHLANDVNLIHVNFVLSLTSLNIVHLVYLGHGPTHSLMVCTVVKIMLQFFYLTAFSFMFVEALNIFVQVNARGSLGRIGLKYFLIGWGIPTITTGSIVSVSQKYGYDSDCKQWCWLFTDNWHLYSFLFPAIVLALVHSIMLSVSLYTVGHWTEEWRFRDRRKQRYSIATSWLLELLLLAMCMSGLLIHISSTTLCMVIFVICDLTLMVTIMLSFLVLRKEVKSSFLNSCRNFNKKPNAAWNSSTNSYKAYMMPETTPPGQTIEATIQHHCDEVNRAKFTRERKRQLQQLLGSSVEHTFGSTNDYNNEADNSTMQQTQNDIIMDDSGMGSDEGSFRTTAILHGAHNDGVMPDSDWDKDRVVYGAPMTTTTSGCRRPIRDMVETWYKSKTKRPADQPDDSDYVVADPLLSDEATTTWPNACQTGLVKSEYVATDSLPEGKPTYILVNSCPKSDLVESEYVMEDGFSPEKQAMVRSNSCQTIGQDAVPVKCHVAPGKEGALQFFDPVEVKTLLDTGDQLCSHSDKVDPAEASMVLLIRETKPITHATREYSF